MSLTPPICGTFNDAIAKAAAKLYTQGYSIRTETWHAAPLEHSMWEVLNVSFMTPIPLHIDALQKDVRPNLPWADEHFDERVSGVPHNPPPSHVRWPFAQRSNDKHTAKQAGVFSHTYPERMWPKNLVTPTSHQMTQGIRYNYGDARDVVRLLVREPFTRQAYLPIWFPEDTGATEGQRVPCTLGYHFIRRDKWLHCIYYIRSCDFMRHFRDDIYLTCRLAYWMIGQANELKPTQWKGVQPGYLTMHITSLHCFENEREMLRKHMAGR